MKSMGKKIKGYSIIFLMGMLTMLTSACSHQQKKANKKNTEDRSKSLAYTQDVSFIAANSDTVVTIKVALADDENERSEGLMDVRDMPQSKGMLFIFEDNKPRSFWMANTPLSLDIIFVNADKKIVRIHHNAQPFSEKNLKSNKPAEYVIETNAGFSISHDIQEGMMVAF